MPIVTDGLVGYWNSKQGVVGSVWENITPDAVGMLNGTISGALVQTDGMYFDGVDDAVQFTNTLGLSSAYDYTIETWVKLHINHNFENAIVSIDGLGSMFSYASNKYKFYANGSRTTLNNFPPNILNHVVVRVINSTQQVELYVGGVMEGSYVTGATSPFDRSNWAIGKRPGNSFSFFKGHISVVRFYNRLLTPTEIAQNNAVNTEVGLTESSTIESGAAIVTSIVANKTKISDESGVNQSIITVQFDKDVIQYVARLNGVDHTTGTLVHQGGAVAANVNAQIIVDWNELSTEGSNRINIYGKDSNNTWTLYNVGN